MGKRKNWRNRLMAVVLSLAMILSPILQDMTAYAAGNTLEAGGVGTLPEVAVTEKAADSEGAELTVPYNGTTDGTEFGGVNVSFFSARAASGFSKVGGWNESIYAEIAGVEVADVTEVSWIGTMTGKLGENDLKYLVRKIGDVVRIDIPGLKAGKYTLTVVTTSGTYTESDIEVYAYDRSGYAHFNYTEGVGAYDKDGTLKKDAIVIYVTDDNKNTVELSYNGTKVNGIGNILNTVGKACGEAGHENECKKYDSNKKKSYYAKANTNQDILKKLADGNVPLVVRFVGTVSDSGLYKRDSFNASSASLIEGLTAYATGSDNGGLADYGGTGGDNGHMARMKSGKNITLEGIGYDATIDGWGFHFMCESANAQYGKSFEVRNLTFINTPEDAIGMEGVQSDGKITASVERCWIHHNEFYCPNIASPAESDKAQGDGSVDFKRGQYFTCSYNYYEGCHKTNLVGSSDSSLQFNLTYHHNHWKSCEARGPLARQANIHMYNNLYEMQTSYAMNPRANAYIFSEYNMFYASKSPMEVKLGAVKSYHDSFASVIESQDGTIVTDKNQKVPNNCKYLTTDLSSFDTDPTLSYIPSNNYQLDEDFTHLRKVIVSQTGTQNRYPKLPENMNSSDYTMLPSGTSVTQVTPPQTLTPGKIKGIYAFEVTGSVDVTVDTNNAVLVSEAGAALLIGGGTVPDLPAGIYWVQPMDFSPGKNGAAPSYKDALVNSIDIKAHDPNAHYHTWVLDSTVNPTCTGAGKKVYRCTGSGTCDANGTKEETLDPLGHDYTVPVTTTKDPTCTEAGEGTFKCSRCDSTYSGTVAALGHSWGSWEVVTAATADTEGEEKRVCTRDSAHTETRVIPKGGTGGGNDDSSDGVVFNGDYVLTFEGGKANGATDFFTLKNGSYENVTAKRTPTVNGTKYQGSFKLNNANASITFTCDDDVILFMACSTEQTGKQIQLDNVKYPTKTDSNATLTIELEAGEHTITKESQPNICYLALAYKKSVVYHKLSFVYNYSGETSDDSEPEDEPDPRTIQVVAGQTYSTMAALVPSSFTRNGYKLKGLYEDAACTKPITYPYTVSKNVDFYALWEEDDTPTEETHLLFFDANGGSSLVPVSVSKTQIYTITQRPTREGYTFAGWYDALEGGNVVDRIDGSALTGNITVHAHWNVSEIASALDCAKDLNSVADSDGNIKGKTEIKGFTIHALPGGGGAAQDSPKYYMTVKSNMLYTNGVLLDDTSIKGNEEGLLKSIEFTTEGPATLTVEVALSGKPESGGTYNLVLAKKAQNGSLEEVGSSPITNGTTKTTKIFNIDGADTYYLYAKGDKGVAYSSLKLTEQVYTVLYQVGNGIVPEGAGSVAAREGEAVQLPVCTANPGYIFKDWTMDGETKLDGSYTVNPDDASDGLITITARYDLESYTINFDANGGTLPDGMTATRQATVEDTIPLGDCGPKEGQQFLGWTVNGSGDKLTKSYKVNPADAVEGADGKKVITLKAVYTEAGKVYYTVKFDVGGGKLPDTMEASVLKEANDTVELGTCTPPTTDQEFIGWSVEGTDKKYTSSYTVNPADATDVDGQKVITLKAVYTEAGKKYYTVRFSAEGSKLPAGMSAIVKAEVGDLLTLGECASPAADKRFVGWSVGDSTETITDEYKVKAEDADANDVITIKAVFKEKGTGIAIIGLEASYEYTGAKIIPNIGVVDYDIGDGKILAPGVDYSVQYKNNSKAGSTATVTVTGKGNYAGKDITQSFTIVEAANAAAELKDLKGAKLAKIDAVTYNGSAQHPKLTLTLKQESAVEYTYDETAKVYKAGDGSAIPANVAFSNNINKGTATVLITGANDAKGNPSKIKKSFKI
ncbi:MAG: InlB B-repeat-containing protein, partial [Butyrivibrio sp.]|nr:InlB B-repeat-containing protein [Butyrivibrio sp.]